MKNPNQYITEFIEYYCSLNREPEYAVLIKGKWGTGKTWFIKNTLNKIYADEGDYLYVSLNGVTSFDEIESDFFRQLHPVLSSKGVALAGKFAKGLLKATLKFDIDNDGKDDGSITTQIPKIEIPEYLTNTSRFTLVFDDLERVSLPIESVLGYINNFVEHQGYKVLIVANEEEIRKKDEKKNDFDESYRRIKEKLIGKTLEISPDLDGALKCFLDTLDSSLAKKFCQKNIGLISEYYGLSQYQNLRHLKHALWDFERIVNFLPTKAAKKNELLEHLLKEFLILSFEIKSGIMLPSDIGSLKEDYYATFGGAVSEQSSDEDQEHYARISEKYHNNLLHEFLFKESIWSDFFESGKLSEKEIVQSVLDSVYIRQDNRPDWEILWHVMDRTDAEFETLLNSVASDFEDLRFDEIPIIKHVTGLLIFLSKENLYKSSPEEILKLAISQVDESKASGKVDTAKRDPFMSEVDRSWGGLGFMSSDSDQFQKLCKYCETIEVEARTESYPELSSKLLELARIAPHDFYKQVVYGDNLDCIYYDVPILSHIDANKFVKKFIELPTHSQRTVSYAIKARYEHESLNAALMSELEWLDAVTELLRIERSKRTNKISGFQINNLIANYFEVGIKRLSGDGTELK